ncbi:MAG: hypothetical protein QXU99_00180 [Candidatus Bathyarchaeia archaeon]
MKAVAALVLVSLVLSVSILDVPAKTAYEPLNLTIKLDGSIEPETNLLERNGTIYTFKGDIFGTIKVQKDGITIDGAGHTLQGRGGDMDEGGIGINLISETTNSGWRNVLVKNLRICDFHPAIFAVGGSNSSFIGNYFCRSSVVLFGNANITGNLITHNTFNVTGIFLDYNRGKLDIITENNFLTDENSNYYPIGVGLADMPIVDRNYWSDYTTKYPNAKELEGSGVWDTPYTFDNPAGSGSIIDRHPLVNPVTDSEIPDFINPYPTPTPSPTETPTATPKQQQEIPQTTEIYIVTTAIAGIFVAVAIVLLRKCR